jgi:hypothetical protein
MFNLNFFKRKPRVPCQKCGQSMLQQETIDIINRRNKLAVLSGLKDNPKLYLNSQLLYGGTACGFCGKRIKE